MTTIIIGSANRCWARGSTVAETARKMLTLSEAPSVRVQVSVFSGPDEKELHDRIKVHGDDGTLSYPEALELVTQFTVRQLADLLR